MDDNKKDIGKKLLKILETEGAPWSVGTLAIISALGLRLINLSLKSSGYSGYNKEIETFFTLCDEDDQLFDRYLQDKDEQDLNIIPKKLLYLLVHILEELSNSDYKIKRELVIDYKIGVDILLLSTTKTAKIIMENNNDKKGDSTIEYEAIKNKINSLRKRISDM